VDDTPLDGRLSTRRPDLGRFDPRLRCLNDLRRRVTRGIDGRLVSRDHSQIGTDVGCHQFRVEGRESPPTDGAGNDVAKDGAELGLVTDHQQGVPGILVGQHPVHDRRLVTAHPVYLQRSKGCLIARLRDMRHVIFQGGKEQAEPERKLESVSAALGGDVVS